MPTLMTYGDDTNKVSYSYDNLGRTAAKTLTVGGRAYETGYSYLPGTTATFDYNADDLRIRKTVNGVETNYTLHGKNIVHMIQGANDLHFWYAQCFSLREALVSGGDFESLALSLALLGVTTTPSTAPPSCSSMAKNMATL